MMPWRPEEPYDSLPLLPPALDLETKAVLRQCVTAHSALAELRKAVELIPNPGMLINTLPVLEAREPRTRLPRRHFATDMRSWKDSVLWVNARSVRARRRRCAPESAA